MQPDPLQPLRAKAHVGQHLRADRPAGPVPDPDRHADAVERLLGPEPDLEHRGLALGEAVARRPVAGHGAHLVHAAETRRAAVRAHPLLLVAAGHEAPVVGVHDVVAAPSSTTRPSSSMIARSQTRSTAFGSCETKTIVPPAALKSAIRP